MSLENGKSNGAEKSKDHIEWKQYEKDPQFRALMLTAFHMGSTREDIIGILQANIPYLASKTISLRSVNSYIYPDRSRGETQTARDRLSKIGAPRAFFEDANRMVHEYMSAHDVSKFWPYAHDTRAIAVYLLEERKMALRSIGRLLSRYLNIEITTAVPGILVNMRTRIKKEFPELSNSEVLAHSKEQLLRELKAGLSEEELLCGQKVATELEKLFSIEKFTRKNSWRTRSDVRSFVADIYRHSAASGRATAEAASEAVLKTYGLSVSYRTFGDYFSFDRAQWPAVITKLENISSSQALDDARAQLQQIAHIAEVAETIAWPLEAYTVTEQDIRTIETLETDPLVRGIIAAVREDKKGGSSFSFAEQKRIIHVGTLSERTLTELVITLIKPGSLRDDPDDVAAYNTSVSKLKQYLECIRNPVPAELLTALQNRNPPVHQIMLRWVVRGKGRGPLTVYNHMIVLLPRKYAPLKSSL